MAKTRKKTAVRPAKKPTARRARGAGNKRTALALSITQAAAFDGWNDAAIANGAEAMDLTVADAAEMFPLGLRQVMSCFSDWATDEMTAALKKTPHFAKWRTRDKVAFGVITRLEAMEPYRTSMQRLVLWAALPANAPAMMRQMWKVADTIWVNAGDKSDDYNYYTKRGLLVGVIKATCLFWLQDKSKDMQRTRAFLDREVNVISAVGQRLGVLKSFDVTAVMDFVRRFTERAA